jgi:hypothetical protein
MGKTLDKSTSRGWDRRCVFSGDMARANLLQMIYDSTRCSILVRGLVCVHASFQRQHRHRAGAKQRKQRPRQHIKQRPRLFSPPFRAFMFSYHKAWFNYQVYKMLCTLHPDMSRTHWIESHPQTPLCLNLLVIRGVSSKCQAKTKQHPLFSITRVLLAIVLDHRHSPPSLLPPGINRFFGSG